MQDKHQCQKDENRDSSQDIENYLFNIRNNLNNGEFSFQSFRDACSLKRIDFSRVDSALFNQVVGDLTEHPCKETIDTIEYLILNHSFKNSLYPFIIPKIQYHINVTRKILFAKRLSEILSESAPNNKTLLSILFDIYIELKEFKQGFKKAELLYQLSENCYEKVIHLSKIISISIQSGAWNNIDYYFREYTNSYINIVDAMRVDANVSANILTSASLFLYLQDSLFKNRQHHRSAASLLESKVKANRHSASINYKEHNRRIKIGYLAHTWRAHSVGWLCRWLFQHHDREKFEIYIYFLNKNDVNQNCNNPFFQTWFAEYIDHSREFGSDANEIAHQMLADKLDILVDLDSTTLDLSCHVMALKPAPIQATWLGRDASGLSSIDYFIADPYVLDQEADQYYQETIWRLPHSYIAVKGFEIGVPTLRRQDLDIAADGVIFLSAQTGMKRHPDLIHLQMKILKQVPNSYFLIKGIADLNSIQTLFTDIAHKEGVNPDRLRFLDRDCDEYTHRANLQIADIILDTYPYNGATTTLEALWSGIPLVTRVGEQFAARNSYTFLKNIGIDEGIAWTDQEYIDWGIKLGQSQELRESIAMKMHRSKHTSPLWNPEQFARNLEAAFRQMIAQYNSSQAS